VQSLSKSRKAARLAGRAESSPSARLARRRSEPVRATGAQPVEIRASHRVPRRHPNRGAALSYARVVLGLIILIALGFFLLNVAIVAAIFGVFALVVLVIIIKEGL
jgi:hypothetical protein